MSFTVEHVAGLGGLTREGESSNWGPCPVCQATQTSKNDKRPPLRFKGADQWLCVNREHSDADEPKGGGPVSLARALNAAGTLSDDDLARVVRDHHGEGGASPQPSADADLAPKPDGTLDVAGGWERLQARPSTWRDRVLGWAAERGLPGEIGEAIVASGSVAAVPAGQWPRPLGGWLSAVRWPPRDLLVALRGVEGDVVDLERRFIRGTGKPAEGPKTARLSGDQSGRPEHYLFGDLPAAIEAARKGEPVILVEGSSDWAVADACCRIRSKGAALGSYGATALRKVAKRLVVAAQDAGLVPGSFTVHVVPDVGDWADKPAHDAHRIGERWAWNAAIDLLDVARVRWCPPLPSGTGDLSDALSGQHDSVGVFWSIIDEGLPVLDSGVTIGGTPLDWHPKRSSKIFRRWHRMTDWELQKYAYRLPLSQYIHYHHFYGGAKEDDDIVFDPTVRHRFDVDGPTRIRDAIKHWLRVHGIIFSRDSERLWLWDPVETARAPLIDKSRPRAIPRTISVRGDYWHGWLDMVGAINPKAGQGRSIEHAMYQMAQAAPRAELRSWIAADGLLSSPVVRVLLGTRSERVLRLDVDGLSHRSNGEERIILERDTEVPVIHYVDGMSTADASALWWRLAGSCLTIPHPVRSMMIAHTLLVFIREMLVARPILYSTGHTESGKSMLAKVLQSWLTGTPSPLELTSAAAWALGENQPLLVIDNLEPRHINPQIEQFLLGAATGKKRIKRSSTGDRGVVMQPVKSLVYVNAIGAPPTPEMLRRTLLVEHSMEHYQDGFSEVEHLEAVKRDRSALWTAAIVLYQKAILPALGEGLQRMYQVPKGHPNASMGEALAVMGLIGKQLSLNGPYEWGALDWPAWMKTTESSIADARMHGDPVTLALHELRRQWNRMVIDRYDNRPRRPATEDGLFACRPLFHDLRTGRVTEKEDRGIKVNGVAQVVGFEGEYTELYRDMLAAGGTNARLGDHVVSAKDIGHQMRHMAGWSSEVVWRHKSGRRRYRWVCDEVVEELIEGAEQPALTPKGGFRPVERPA